MHFPVHQAIKLRRKNPLLHDNLDWLKVIIFLNSPMQHKDAVKAEYLVLLDIVDDQGILHREEQGPFFRPDYMFFILKNLVS